MSSYQIEVCTALTSFLIFFVKKILKNINEIIGILCYNTLMKEIIVPKKYNQKKLSTFILDTYPSLRQSIFFKALRKKDIRINDKKISQNEIVCENDKITLYIKDEDLYNSSDIKIVYEDDNIVVAYKPENISVTENSNEKYTLTSYLQEKIDKNVMPCHRIDRNTKGLVLFAKNKESLDILLDKFKKNEIEKYYIAIVYGLPKENHKLLKDYLFKDSKKNQVYISNVPKKGYQEIITEYKVITKDLEKNTSTLEIVLHTGKTHQIRAHLAYHGFPIIGDGKYGDNKINKSFDKKHQELYSYKLVFKFKGNNGILDYLNNKVIRTKGDIM